ncbi:MAG: tetratricopeptide repeat protein [Lacinutrix sp.]
MDSHYNIGVISAENGEIETARKAYSRVLTLDPTYTKAVINLSKTCIDEAGEVVDLMNKLGISSEENKRFDDYHEEQIALYKNATLVLENIVEKITINDSNLISILT